MLLRRELRRNLKAFLISTGICTALSLYLVALIPTMGGEMQQMLDLKMPKQLQLAFGMQGLDFSSPMSTYALMYSYLYLTLGLFAATTFGQVVAKEFADKTAEFLFSLPARRIDILRTKLLVAAGYLTAAVAVLTIATAVGFRLIIGEGQGLGALVEMAVGYWVGAMFMGALAFLLSARFVRTRMAIGIVMGAYLLQVVISLNDGLAPLKYLSPFDWFKGNAIVSGGLDPASLAIGLVATAMCLVAGVRLFVRKDVLV